MVIFLELSSWLLTDKEIMERRVARFPAVGNNKIKTGYRHRLGISYVQ